MEMLGEHATTKNEDIFFKLIDELQEDWKDRYENLEVKGQRQKSVLEDELKKDMEVLKFTVNHENAEKQRLETQLQKENQRIEDLNMQLK